VAASNLSDNDRQSDFSEQLGAVRTNKEVSQQTSSAVLSEIDLRRFQNNFKKKTDF
jgi:hypothetical protein